VFSSEEMIASGDPAFPEVAVDTLIADPPAISNALGAPTLAAAMSSGVVLASEEATLRKVSTGDTIMLAGGGSVKVTAVLDAHILGGHEMAAGPAIVQRGRAAVANYLLVADQRQ
jgi:hypothetical protein